MWQPLWAPMTIASCGQSGKCQCVMPFWSTLAIARLAPRCNCHTGPCRGSEPSVSMCNCQNGHNWQLPVWGQSGQNLLCMQLSTFVTFLEVQTKSGIFWFLTPQNIYSMFWLVSIATKFHHLSPDDPTWGWNSK